MARQTKPGQDLGPPGCGQSRVRDERGLACLPLDGPSFSSAQPSPANSPPRPRAPSTGRRGTQVITSTEINKYRGLLPRIQGQSVVLQRCAGRAGASFISAARFGTLVTEASFSTISSHNFEAIIPSLLYRPPPPPQISIGSSLGT
ncbi:hypothetical protein MRS44_008853 [Fusarium solani]|uniref:uncharacterized protein n=1 Tax=Fusarium solani TaxID=169388 RepID=UPI0032C49B8B|nr:hypothetical protein MRS44_008853 [Fusarium solani]